MIGPTIGSLLPSAVAVALSPIPIIAVVLMLGTPRAKSNGPAFALGWVVGLSVVSALVIWIAGGTDDADSGASNTADVIKILLGILFFGLAALQWRKRPSPGVEPEMPKWRAAIDSLTGARAIGFRLLLSAANPKNLALTLTAAVSIAQAGLDGAETTITIAVFVLVGSVTVLRGCAVLPHRAFPGGAAAGRDEGVHDRAQCRDHGGPLPRAGRQDPWGWHRGTE